ARASPGRARTRQPFVGTAPGPGPPVPSRPVGAGRGGRVRRPPPLLRKRLPSGRGASEQPNTTDETARLTPVFWALLLATAVATGLLGSALMFLLTTVEHLAFGYDSGTLEDGAEHASAVRRVTSLVVAGA